MRLVRPGPLMAAVVSAALLAACGGGGAAQPTRPPDTVPSAQPTNSRTPFPQPTVIGNDIVSPKGYAATLPDGWRVRANFVLTVDGSADGFFEPLKPGAALQPNIVITCITGRFESDEARLSFEKTRTAREGNNTQIVVSTRTLAGLQATQLSYHFKSQNEPNTPELEKTDYLFENQRCDWRVTTTAPSGQREAYQPIFDIFLNSLRLTS